MSATIFTVWKHVCLDNTDNFFNNKSADGGQGPPTWQILSDVSKYLLDVLREKLDCSFVVCNLCLVLFSIYIFYGIQIWFFLRTELGRVSRFKVYLSSCADTLYGILGDLPNKNGVNKKSKQVQCSQEVSCVI